MELVTYNLTEDIEVSYENILKMHFIPNSNKLALLKVNSSWRLFVEIIDFNSSLKAKITLDNKLRFYYREFEHNTFVNYSKDLSHLGKYSLTHIFEFYLSEDLEFIYLKARFKKTKEEVCHFKIDFEGKVVLEKIEDESHNPLDDYCFLKKYLVSDNFIFLDLEDFSEHDLADFFDTVFYKDDFLFLRFNGDEYPIFSLPDKNLLGLVFFDRDGNYPRGSFNVFRINDIKKPVLLFSYKIDDFGSNHIFNSSGNKILYYYYIDLCEIKIKIRELSKNDFENAIEFTLSFSKEDSAPHELFFSDANLILLVFYDRIEVYNIHTLERISIYNRDIGTSYCFDKNKLFYIYLNKLKMEVLA
ncbi:hypothetical protein C8C83_4717 [Flavobacterium sp. 90]|uniref:hypothetical protein n=1 Tax=unclassified Flavobacterium TaxID=196869 RepID=UPI000EB2D113|nr:MULTISPECIES: hypothetical protein [unclassified Flavobacterium]RKR05370.1 hypothetical protein C8C82_5059 [Flavobacterium sp. 81]TCK56685.1 hypothetical protein C8C83_4717 [Flavobacterium sp. 90]